LTTLNEDLRRKTAAHLTMLGTLLDAWLAALNAWQDRDERTVGLHDADCTSHNTASIPPTCSCGLDALWQAWRQAEQTYQGAMLRTGPWLLDIAEHALAGEPPDPSALESMLADEHDHQEHVADVADATTRLYESRRKR
jgi:hypothetical protein